MNHRQRLFEKLGRCSNQMYFFVSHIYIVKVDLDHFDSTKQKITIGT